MIKFLLIFTIPLLSFSQYLFSDNYPVNTYQIFFQKNIFSEEGLNDIVSNHKKIAILPVSVSYNINNRVRRKEIFSTQEIEEMEMECSQAFYIDFYSKISDYSEEINNLISKSQNKKKITIDEDGYIPQTQIDRIISRNNREKDLNSFVKRPKVNLLTPSQTINKLKDNNINFLDILEYSPEKFCEILNVDAIIYINIDSSKIISLSSLGIKDEKNIIGIQRSFNNPTTDILLIGNSIIDEIKGAKFVEATMSIYSSNGMLLWAYKDEISSRYFRNQTDIVEHIFTNNLINSFPYLVK